MSPLKIVTVVGARPQFIKAATVSRAVAGKPGVQEVIVHTGQHYDAKMSDDFFRELSIPEPGHHLGIGSGSHAEQTGRMLIAIERVLCEENPDWVLVYGDTNSTTAGALAAAKLRIPVAHVEAGLRSFNRDMPEELNRVVTDHLSDLLFAPTPTAIANLQKEGLGAGKVELVGDVMYDAAQFYAAQAEARSEILTSLGLKPGEFILATVHRAENTDHTDRLEIIMRGLQIAARRLPVVFPVHPRTLAAMEKLSAPVSESPSFKLIPPIGYLDMTYLERHAAVIATDSGGVQKEACFHNTPCVTLRDETEWVELLDAGCNQLCSLTDPETVAETILTARDTRWDPVTEYGDGRAACRIVDMLLERGGK